MTRPLRFHPLVARDVRRARQWYDEIAAELGESFREIVDARFDDIERRPRHFPTAFGDVRFAKLKRFPYIILFRELDEHVHVLGVFHGSSDPAKWQERSGAS